MTCQRCGATWENDPLYNMALASHGIDDMTIEYHRLFRLMQQEGCAFIRCEVPS